MKKFLSLWALLLTLFMQAQTSAPVSNPMNLGSITGKITEKKTNSPIAYASVTVKDGDKVISGAITKENGNFTVTNLPFKDLLLEIQYMGFKKYSKSFNLSAENKTLNLNTIVLEEEVTELKEVSVVKEKSTIEQKIDRKVITVGKDLVSAGATAAEIMNNIPSVSIDQQNNTVSLRGNENVKIFIDGKPSNLTPMQALQQIPSTSIKQIELITNPSAKYNPEGMSGIINIVLNKNAIMGFNGNINTGVNFGITPKFNGSLDMNYRVNKFNFYTTQSTYLGQNRNRGNVNTETYNGIDNNTMDFYIRNDNKNYFTKTGLDFYLNDKNTLSFYTIQSFDNEEGFFRTDINYTTGSNLNKSQVMSPISKTRSETYNLVYRKKFDKADRTLDIEANYNRNNEPEDTRILNGNLDLLSTNQISNKNNNLIFNIDYSTPISDKAKIELGVESRFDGTKNNFDINAMYNSDFDYKRNIQSGYFNYSRNSGKWEYQLGTRIESYDVKADFRQLGQNPGQFKDYIFTFYPSAFFTYNASEKNSFNFSYSRRVDRPNLGQVNPIRKWTSPTIDQVGNSDLKPQFTNSIETNYTRKTKIGSITTGAFFRYINDEIEQVLYKSPFDPNKKVLTFANFNHNTQYGVEVSGNLDFKKWWSLNFGVDSYFKNTKGTVQDAAGDFFDKTVNATVFNARMNHTFKLTKDFRLIWFTMYRAPENGLQFSSKEMWKTDLGARLNILKGKGTFSVRYNDIFNQMRARFTNNYPDKIDGQFRWESQTVNVNFSYRFGSGKDRALQRKQREQNETQGGGLF